MRILDSDHWVALLRGQLTLAERVAMDEDLAITAVSVGELVHGAYKSRRVDENLARVAVLLAGVVVLPFDAESAHWFGRLKAELESAGTRLGDLDLQIAGIAMRHGASLVTHNLKHFERVTGLTLEDWLQERE